MKNITLRPLFAVIAFCIFSFAQAQMKYWTIPPKKIDVSLAVPQITGLGGIPQTVAQEANGIYDAGNNLMFYVSDVEIFNSAGGQIGLLNAHSGDPSLNEIAIVPFLNNDGCNNKKYYVFYLVQNPEDVVGVEYWYSIVNMASGSPVIIGGAMIDKIGGSAYGGIAVGPVSGGQRFVYVVRGTMYGTGGVDRITLSAPAGNNTTGLSSVTRILGNGSSNNITLDYSTMEVDLSQDGSKLAWGGVNQANNSSGNTNRYYIIGLDPNGNYISGSLKQFNVGSPATTAAGMGRGVEFNAAGTELFVGSGADGVYYVPVNNISNSTRITNSDVQLLGFSQLELAQNGFIYAAKSNVAIPIDPVNNIIGPANANISPITPGKNTNFGLMPNFYTLPDQIDGENYSSFNIAPLAYTTSSFTAPSPNLSPRLWTMQANDITGTSNPPVIRIQTKLTIPSSLDLTMQNMIFEFGPGASLEVQQGAVLRLDNTILRGVPCNSMWQGVVVPNGGSIYVTNSSQIRDAKIAIDATGANAKVNTSGNSLFDADGTEIRLTSCNGANIRIVNTRFYHTIPLKDQIFGQQTTGVLDGNYYFGKTSIEIVNANSTITIGDPVNTSFRNTFSRGQFGINITNSNVDVKQNTFDHVLNTAVWGDGTNQNRTVNIIGITQATPLSDNQFTLVTTGIDFKNGINSTIQGNTFNSGIKFGISWHDNSNKQLQIGGFAAVLKNTFYNNNWAAIMTNANAGAQTQIRIVGNSINGPWYAGGIVVQEWALSSSPSYQVLDINNNTIGTATNRIGDGIIVNKVRGSNNSPSLVYSSVGNISYNTINFTVANIIKNRRGIKCTDSPGLRVNGNTISSDNSWDWQNSGIHFENSNYSLLHENTIQAGKGIQVTGNMMYSHYFCNSFISNVVGVQLDQEILRFWCSGMGCLFPDIYFHGNINSSRKNNFSNHAPWGADIEVYHSDKRNNQWYFKTGEVPYIIYTGASPMTNPSTIVKTTSAFSPCEFLPPPPDPITNERAVLADTVMQWISDYEYYVQKLQTNKGNSDVSVFIKKAVKIEDAIAQGNYNQANGLMNGLTPTIPLETYLKNSLTIILASRTPVVRPLTQNEINTLTAIAQLNPLQAGPAVYSARAVLKSELNLDFTDDQITGKTIFGQITLPGGCSQNGLKNIPIGIIDNNQNIQTSIRAAFTDSTGKFVFDPYQLRMLDTTRLYGFYDTTGTYPVVLAEFKTIRQWISSGLITVNLNCPPTIMGVLNENPSCGGAPTTGDTLVLVDASGNLVPGVHAVITDANGAFSFNAMELSSLLQDSNLFSFKTIGAFPLQDADNQTIAQWITQSPVNLILKNVKRVWHAEWINEDSVQAIGQALDINGNVYVLGTLSKGYRDNTTILKYNKDGILLREIEYGDSLTHNTPIAFFVDSSSNVYATILKQSFAESSFNNKIITLKYDSRGNFLWENAYDVGENNVIAVSMKNDDKNNSYVVFTSASPDAQISSTYLHLIKYSKNGILEWEYNQSDAGRYFTDLVLINADLYVTGYDNNTFPNPILLYKFGSVGNLVWEKQYINYESPFVSRVSIKKDRLDNIILFGSGIFKIDTLGNSIWSNLQAATSNIAVDVNNDIVAGAKNTIRRYSNSTGAENLYINTNSNFDLATDDGNNIYSFVGSKPAALNKYSSSGLLVWSESLEDIGRFSVGRDLVISRNDNVYVTGYTVIGANNQNNIIGIITAKYSQCPSDENLLRNVNSSSETIANVVITQPVISIYPNPSNGLMTVNYSIPEHQEGVFEIHNLIGVKVANYSLQSGGTNMLSISNSDLTEGIYMYRIISNNKMIDQGKIVIIK